MSKIHQWAVIGAGPAGLASVGILIDSGVDASDIVMFDPCFDSGALGSSWGEVSSNTSVKHFLDFFYQIKSFDFESCPHQYLIHGMQEESRCLLKHVAEPLSWVSRRLLQKVDHFKTRIESLEALNGCWQLSDGSRCYQARQVILAMGSKPKSLCYKGVKEIKLKTALTPQDLLHVATKDDSVAVFGSSHSSMIIVKNLIDCGVKAVINFYLRPFRYAINMGDWTLYDNTGLKGETADWVRQNISGYSHPDITRFISSPENIKRYLPQCNKAVYAIGFDRNRIAIPGIDIDEYDPSNGIIAPGLFGVGIGFPLRSVDPLGNSEFNVGMFKFMRDIKKVMPLWLKYGL